MIINFDRRFIFIANLKCASTSIEQVLRPDSEVAIMESRFGKHYPYRLIEDRFFWIFRTIPKDQFFVFGVMRDPVDYLLSLYNSHCAARFKDDPVVYTGGMSFDDFLTRWKDRNEDQMVPQYTRFLDGGSMIAANYIISYDKLAHGLAEVGREIGVEGLSGVGREHCSEKHLDRNALTPKHLSWIKDTYRKDYEFLKNYSDRVMR